MMLNGVKKSQIRRILVIYCKNKCKFYEIDPTLLQKGSNGEKICRDKLIITSLLFVENIP